MQSSFLTQPASGYQEGPKQHGGSRRIVLQPPVFLLFDDPANTQATEENERLVAGRVAKIRSASCLNGPQMALEPINPRAFKNDLIFTAVVDICQ